MIIYNVEQGSAEWIDLRTGIPTASSFDNILTRGGKRSESREPYILKLLAERCMGHACQEHISMWMQRGRDEEVKAVRYYELIRDVDTIPVGFVTNDEGTWGASPDRFVGATGMLEIKVPSEWVHMGYLLHSGKAYDKYMVQVQGQLLVNEDREWTDIMSYHPELPDALMRIERDDKYIRLLDKEVREFSDELEQRWQVCIENGWAKDRHGASGGEGNRARGGNLGAPLPSLSDLVKASLIEIENRKKVLA